MLLNEDDPSDFWPPFCPNAGCPQASGAARAGFFRHGHYSTRIYGRRIPRFLCRSCRRTMSSQTFDATYRLRMPGLETAILQEIARGSSLRKVAQVLCINRKTVSRRLKRASAPPTPAPMRAVAEPPSTSTPRRRRSVRDAV